MSGGRLCPRCSTLVESNSAIFCYNCGQELSNVPNLPLPENSFLVSSPVSPTSPRSKVLIHLLSGLTVLLMLTLFLSFYFLSGQSLKRPSLPSRVNDLVSTIAALPQAPFSFGRSNFAALTPAEADLYLEGGNLRSFLVRFLSSPSQLDLSERVGLSLEEITSFFESDFAFLKSASAAALLTVNRDPEFVKNRIEKLRRQKKLDDFQADLVGDYLVVSNSGSFSGEIRKTFEKKQLSLLLTSKYLETLKRLPSSGQLLIYGSNFDSLLYGLRIFFGPALDTAAKTLRGTALVVDNRSGSVLLKGPYE